MSKIYILIFGLLLSLFSRAENTNDSMVIVSGEEKFKLVYIGSVENKKASKNEWDLKFAKFNFNKKTNEFDKEPEVISTYKNKKADTKYAYFKYGQLLTMFDIEFMAKDKKGRYKIENEGKDKNEEIKSREEFAEKLRSLAGDKELPASPAPSSRATQPEKINKKGGR